MSTSAQAGSGKGTHLSWGTCLPCPTTPAHLWAEPGAANMDGAVSGQQALSSGLWASLCVGKDPPPGAEGPLLLPGSCPECSQGSLQTTESSSGSTGQPHPPRLVLGALRAPSLTNHALGCPQPTQGCPGGSQELQAERATLKRTGPWDTHPLPEKPLSSGLLEWGIRQWWTVHLPTPCWEPWVLSVCSDPLHPPGA